VPKLYTLNIASWPIIGAADMATYVSTISAGWNWQCITNVLVDMFPPLVMEMLTGSTNNHIFQIYFVLAAPMYWWVG
jgi:hypothetical protein